MAHDIVVQKLLEKGIQITKKNYLALAYFDSEHVVGEEELPELPPGFEDWPETEADIN